VTGYYRFGDGWGTAFANFPYGFPRVGTFPKNCHNPSHPAPVVLREKRPHRRLAEAGDPWKSRSAFEECR
jgi:hypothetical protein